MSYDPPSSRRRDSKYIDCNPDDFESDKYDREHFTMEPVAFENSAFQEMDANRRGLYEVNPEVTEFNQSREI